MLLLFWVTVREGGSLFTPEVQLLFAAAPLPAAVDWLAQTSRRLESTNLRRVLSGGLLGAAVADLLLLVVTRQWELALAGVGVLIGYLGVVLLVLRATGGWRTVLREHFPGLEGDPIP